MFPELSLHVLDIAENSVRAGAKTILIRIEADVERDEMVIGITDDGCGMSAEEIARVTDPFYTTRDTRGVGLGIPFLKQACELTGGALTIGSDKGEGTRIRATFVLSSIDRMPLGDMTETIHALMTAHEDIRWIYRFSILKKGTDADEGRFVLDSGEMREVLGADISFQTPEVSQYIRDCLDEGYRDVVEATHVTDL